MKTNDKNPIDTLIGIYAKTWKERNVELLIPYLAESFTYSSMWVYADLDRSGYIDYLKAKFAKIKESGSKIKVNIGKNEIGNSAVVLLQDRSEPVFITIKESEGKIISAYMSAF